MKTYDATEQAYKNDYEKGYEQGKKDARKKGWWVCLEPEIGYFACTVCDHRILRAKCNYCPNCGADMRGEEDGK